MNFWVSPISNSMQVKSEMPVFYIDNVLNASMYKKCYSAKRHSAILMLCINSREQLEIPWKV